MAFNQGIKNLEAADQGTIAYQAAGTALVAGSHHEMVMLVFVNTYLAAIVGEHLAC